MFLCFRVYPDFSMDMDNGSVFSIFTLDWL
jgi:hypothetical protein